MNEKKYLKQLTADLSCSLSYLQGINAKGIVLKKGRDFLTESLRVDLPRADLLKLDLIIFTSFECNT
jgi:hypothetical protein